MFKEYTIKYWIEGDPINPREGICIAENMEAAIDILYNAQYEHMIVDAEVVSWERLSKADNERHKELLEGWVKVTWYAWSMTL